MLVNLLAMLMISAVTALMKTDLTSLTTPAHDFPVFPAVDVDGLGRVYGTLALPAVAYFLGIPYAKPPTGTTGRFQPPKQPASWWTPLMATSPGSSCVQGLSTSEVTGSEDCLYLNIATPLKVISANASKQPLLPVMVWIHGGAYSIGSGDLYPAERLVQSANGSVVCVTINYRLGVFGFLGGDIVSAGSTDGSSGNFGIADQRAAMHWVHDHIASFGGDPEMVTIFGESAGGNSVMNHLVQKASFPLYHRAIIQSGTYTTGGFSMKYANFAFNELLKNSGGCADLACLVELDSVALQNASIYAQLTLSWAPVIDNVKLTAAPAVAIKRRQYNRAVPVLIGSNRDEYAYWAASTSHPPPYSSPSSLSESGFNQKVASWKFGVDELDTLKGIYQNTDSMYQYPTDPGPWSDWWWASTRVGTDLVPGLGACGVRWLSQLLVDGGTPSVYVYLFAQPEQEEGYGFYPGNHGSGPGSVVVPHGSQISYVFGAINGAGREAGLASATASYWSSFARTGDPSKLAIASVKWPPYNITEDKLIRFDIQPGSTEAPGYAMGDGIQIQSKVRQGACDYMQGRFHGPKYTLNTEHTVKAFSAEDYGNFEYKDLIAFKQSPERPAVEMLP